jgi:hypothetical protein
MEVFEVLVLRRERQRRGWSLTKLTHNLEAERSVLGAILIDNVTFSVAAAAIVDSRVFFRDAHRRIFERMVALSRRGQPIDLVTLREELELAGELDEVGGPSYIASLVDGVPRATNVESYARIVNEKAVRRRLLEVSRRLAEGAYDDEDLADVTERATQAITTAMECDSIQAVSPRKLRLTPASSIAVRPVRWLWDGRIALGSFGLLGGREGIGKSLVGYTLAAELSRGRLAGAFLGIKKAVVVVATEDSKAHTIIPRLMAAGADLTMVHFVTVVKAGADTELVLPVDVPELARAIREVSAALVLFDPLMSRLAAALDSHKDAEVRRALEPLAQLADETNTSLVGLIHVNKASTNDPLTMLMASRAFAAVARFVLFAMVDPEDEQKRILGLAKSNLGRTDVPTLSYRIMSHRVAETAEGEVWTGRLEWLGEAAGTIREAIQHTTTTGDKSATSAASEWLMDYLVAVGGSADSAEVKRAGAKAGHTADHVRRARERLRLKAVSVGFPRTTKWALQSQSGHGSGHIDSSSLTTATTATTGEFSDELIDCRQRPVAAVRAVREDSASDATTGPEPINVRI